MKFLVICLLIAFVVALPAPEPSDDEEWKAFMEMHVKTGFKSAEEHDLRKALFKEAHKVIKAHNKENPNFKLAHNQHSIMTGEELAQRLGKIPGMNKVNVQARSIENLMNERATIPASYDLRKTACGQKMAIKNQGKCGCCWAFSAVAPIEYQKCNMTGKYVPLSEEMLIDCDTIDQGCHGGDPTYAYYYLMQSSRNVATNASYPFSAEKGVPQGSCKSKYEIGATLTDYVTIGPWTTASNMVAPIQNAIMTYGVVSACLLVSNNTSIVNGQAITKFQLYQSGVFTDSNCDKFIVGAGQDVTNHCVALVGWGREDNLDYWIVRNQWGSNWGIDGHMKIKRGVNMCGIEGEVTYVTVA